MWVEFLSALLVEGYREFMEWWQARTLWRRLGEPEDDADERAADR